jgi:hypothetical protein
VDFIEGKERGVFAKNRVKEGTIISTSYKQTANFDEGLEFRKYLASIPQPLACDVIGWSYIWLLDKNDPESLRISVDLDEGSLKNTALNPEEKNVDIFPETNVRGGLGNWKKVASRDIQAGEELLLDYTYGDFDIDAWYKFDL